MNALGIVKKPQLGGDIDAYCGRCKEVREHVIAALNAQGLVERVQCRTCQSNHLFRQKQPKSTSTRSSKASSKDASALAGDGAPLRAYSMQERFNVGDRVEHPKFGLGVVVDVRSGKIDVKFGREVKTLIHAG
jgi:hypothetical protein